MVRLEVICVFIFVFIPFSILQSPYPSGERLFFGEKYLKGLAPCLAKVRQWLLKATRTVSALPQGGKGWQLSWKEEGYRAELQNQLQRWEWKEVTWENVKDCQQLKIDHALPTDTSPPAQLHKPTPSQEQPSPELRPHRKPPPKKSKHSSEQAQPRLLAQLRKAGLPPRADSHVPPREAQRQHYSKAQVPLFPGETPVQTAPRSPKSLSKQFYSIRKLTFSHLSLISSTTGHAFSFFALLYFLVVPQGTWDLTSLTRNQTCTPSVGSTESSSGLNH